MIDSFDTVQRMHEARLQRMAWSRTAAALMAFWIGLAFVLLGVALRALSIVQYRRSIASLRPMKSHPVTGICA